MEDADWASSDKPILLTSDGCIHVLDCSLQLSINVEMNLRELEGTLIIPWQILCSVIILYRAHLLPPCYWTTGQSTDEVFVTASTVEFILQY